MTPRRTIRLVFLTVAALAAVLAMFIGALAVFAPRVFQSDPRAVFMAKSSDALFRLRRDAIGRDDKRVSVATLVTTYNSTHEDDLLALSELDDVLIVNPDVRVFCDGEDLNVDLAFVTARPHLDFLTNRSVYFGCRNDFEVVCLSAEQRPAWAIGRDGAK